MIAGKVNQAQNVIIAGIKGEGEKRGKRESNMPENPWPRVIAQNCVVLLKQIKQPNDVST